MGQDEEKPRIWLHRVSKGDTIRTKNGWNNEGAAFSMRISTPVNKKTVKHHLDYHGWKYVLLVIIALAGWSLIYTMTKPVLPPDQRIDIYIQSETTMEDTIRSFVDPVWQETVPDVKEVNIATLMLTDEYNASMQMMVHIGAVDGDIYLLDELYFQRFARQGAFVPLEPLVESGKLNVDGIDVQKGYQDNVLEYDKNDVPLKTENHLYGIPLESLYGFMTEMQVDNRKLYAVIANANGNEENVELFFNAMIQRGRGEKPDWLQ